jgi:hypothetical protein
MAINFLNNINLNSIQVENIVIEKFASDAAAGTGVVGQLYFDTTADTLKQYVSDTGGGAAGWIEVGTTSGVETITTTDGTYIDLTPNTPTLGNVTVTADLSAVDGTSIASDRFLTKNNKWATIPFGDITEVQGGTYINVTNQTGPIPIVNHDLTSRTDTTSTASPGYGVSFTAIDSVTTNTTGHVTALNVKTITLPSDTNETYTLPVAAGASNSAIMNLTAGGTGSGIKSSVTVFGTAGRIAITEQTGNNGSITVDFPDNVAIVGDLETGDDLEVGGVITQVQTGELNIFGSEVQVPTATSGGNAPNLAQVELLVAGVGVFKGGYNATTDPGVPVISGGSNIALDQGDYFVVSHDGDITFSGVTTSGNNSGALTNSTALVLQSANTNIVIGMTVTGTGVPSGVTIKTVTNSTNFVLSGAITIPNATSLSFSNRVVKVEVGDFIFANAAITASSDPAASAYTIVQSDANIAGAGATDGATEKGVAGFDSASFDVSASGWVQLNSQRNPYGVSQTLDNTSPVARVEANGLTTFTIDLADASLFGTGALAKNVTAEVTQNVSPYQTVYADVTRSGSASISVIFSGSVAVDIYRVLLTHV